MMQGNPHKPVKATHTFGGFCDKNMMEENFHHRAASLLPGLPDQPADGYGYPFAPCGNVHNLSDLLSGRPNNCDSSDVCVS